MIMMSFLSTRVAIKKCPGVLYRRVRIHKSVKSIPARAFYYRVVLSYLEFHDEIEIIGVEAFAGCTLRRVKLLGVKMIKEFAFSDCYDLSDVEFGDQLEKIEYRAFDRCDSLKRIGLPLNVYFEKYVFSNCPDLKKVDLVGGIHNIVASLHLESWRNEVMNEINRINQVLPGIDYKTREIQQWILSVLVRVNHYKAEHHKLLNEATTLLELALWEANLDDKEGYERDEVRITRGSRKRARKQICVTSGASIVIKNVLPFLVLKS